MSRILLLHLMCGLCLTAASSRAQIIDNLDTAANFSGGFNGTAATANGNGTVTLSRTQSGIDAGVDWRPAGGDGFLSLTTERYLTLTPTGPVNGGTYNVNLLFWEINPSDPEVPVFVTERNWLPQTGTTAGQYLDVAQFAADEGITDADLYFVRFRIDPYTYTGPDPGMTFTRISAIPEPTTTGLLALGAAGLAMLRRKRTT